MRGGEKMPYLIAAVEGSGALSAEQVTSATTALTNAGNTVLDTFISLLPAIAVLSGIGFGIGMISSRFKKRKL